MPIELHPGAKNTMMKWVLNKISYRKEGIESFSIPSHNIILFFCC